MAAAPVKVFDLPLGSRFRYIGGSDVWVLLDRANCGLIASAPNISDPLWMQRFCSIEDTPKKVRELLVEYVPVIEA